MKKIIATVLITIILAGCAEAEPPTPTPTLVPAICALRDPEYIDALDSVFEEWDDALAIADSTGRGNLDGPVARLQEIKRKANSLEGPECAAHAQELLVEHMELVVDGFLSFMRQDDDSVVDNIFDQAFAKQDEYFQEYLGLSE